MAEAIADPEVFADKTIGQADHYSDVIGTLTRKPAVIGHSFGGLLAQIVAGRGQSSATVAVDAAPFRGVLPLPISSLKSAFPVLGNPANRHRAVPLTFEQFRFAFANAVDEDEAHHLYGTFAVPASGAPLFQAATANLNPRTEAKVDTENPDRGPLLIISGDEDNTVPRSISHAAFKRQERNPGVTEFTEILGRGHALTIDSGWRNRGPDRARLHPPLRLSESGRLTWANRQDLTAAEVNLHKHRSVTQMRSRPEGGHQPGRLARACFWGGTLKSKRVIRAAATLLAPLLVGGAMIAQAGAASAGVAGQGGHHGPLYVSRDAKPHNADRSCHSAAFRTIQSAINAAPAGGTVIVCKGTYHEQVVIGRSLSLVGLQATIDRGRCHPDAEGHHPGAPGTPTIFAGVAIRQLSCPVQRLHGPERPRRGSRGRRIDQACSVTSRSGTTPWCTTTSAAACRPPRPTSNARPRDRFPATAARAFTLSPSPTPRSLGTTSPITPAGSC